MRWAFSSSTHWSFCASQQDVQELELARSNSGTPFGSFFHTGIFARNFPPNGIFYFTVVVWVSRYILWSNIFFGCIASDCNGNGFKWWVFGKMRYLLSWPRGKRQPDDPKLMNHDIMSGVVLHVLSHFAQILRSVLYESLSVTCLVYPLFFSPRGASTPALAWWWLFTVGGFSVTLPPLTNSSIPLRMREWW